MGKRDEFAPKVIKRVAERAGDQCSNPGCKIYTVGPGMENPLDVIRISVAAHISAAAEGGPRFDPELTPGQRKSIENAIHLCASCSRLIDANEGKDYPVEKLRLWKKEHEAFVFDRLANPSKHKQKASLDILSHSARIILQRVQQFEHDFLHERDRSFSGNFQMVIERQKVMGTLLNAAMRDLRSELALFPDRGNEVRNIQLASMTIMRLYRLADQTTDEGLLFWGAEVANQASLEMTFAREVFQGACERLREQMRIHLK